MKCELRLVPLNCNKTGVGFTAKPLDKDSNKLHLQTGHGRQFPHLDGGQHFYVRISGCNGCCETSKVIRVDGDVLTLDRTTGRKCQCINSNAMVEYSWNNLHVIRDVALATGLNVESPLKYDHCTRTLSVDCKELFKKDCGGCGCGEGGATGGGTGGAGQQGLRGERGEKGDAGVGIVGAMVSATGELMIMTSDGKTINAGILPQRQGQKGPQGEAGPRGEQGQRGEDGATITAVSLEGTTARFAMSDSNSIDADFSGLKGDQGEQGEKGEKGDKGDKGETGYSFQFVLLDDKGFIFGQPNKQVLLTSPNMPGVTFGPYNTGATGLVEIPKPPIQGKGLIVMNVDGQPVGIGST